MNEQEKRLRIYEFLNAETKQKVYLLYLLSLDRNPLIYAIWGILENKTNATSYRNIGSLKTAIEEEC